MARRTRIARRLLRWVTTEIAAEEMVRELEEEYRLFILPERGRQRAQWWFWGQVLRSMTASLRRPAGVRGPSRAWTGIVDGAAMDVRIAVRSFVRAPAFAVIVIVTLGLGIGANAAMFSVVNAVLIRPLPYDRPEQLVRVWPRGNFDADIVALFGERASTLTDFAAFNDWRFTLTGAGEPTEIAGAVVSTNHFAMLGKAPAIGRTFVPADAQPGAEPIALISHGVWISQFGGDSSIVGRTVALARENVPRRRIVGVMPRHYIPLGYRARIDVWVPLSSAGDDASRTTDLFVTGRLASGVSVERASAEVRQLARAAVEAFPESNTLRNVERANVVPLRDAFVGAREQNALRILLAGVVLVVLIASANVANLLLVRAGAREREVAMRMALGASRRRVVRQLLTESVLLGLAGGAVGLALAVATLSALSRSLPSHMPRAGEVEIDGAVLAFTLLISVGASLLAGSAPAWRTGRTDFQRGLRHGVRSTGGRARYRLNRSLLTLELGFSVVLVVGAGLMLKSLWLMGRVDLGLEPDDVITMRVAPPVATYDTPTERAALYAAVRDRVGRVPGVVDVSVIQNIPMAIGRASRVRYVPDGSVVDPEASYVAALRLIKGDHFRTFGIPLRRGEPLQPVHATAAELAVVIDEALATEGWPGENAVGRAVRILDGALTLRVIGVVGSVRSRIDGDAQPMVYIDFDQWNTVAVPRLDRADVGDNVRAWARAHSLSAYVSFRATADPTEVVNSVRAAVWSVEDDAAIVDVRTMQQVVNAGAASPRFFALLISIFAGLALTLGGIGVYGLLSYLVGQRTHEFGVHLALGAQRGAIVRTVLQQALGPVGVGIALGSVAAFAGSRVLANLLFGVTPFDAFTYGAVVVALVVVAGMAGFVPAVRAAGVDPAVALGAD